MGWREGAGFRKEAGVAGKYSLGLDESFAVAVLCMVGVLPSRSGLRSGRGGDSTMELSYASVAGISDIPGGIAELAIAAEEVIGGPTVSTFRRLLPPLTLPLPLLASGTSVIWLPVSSVSPLIANWATVSIFLVTQLARIFPRCFSPRRERGKSPFATKATISMTN